MNHDDGNLINEVDKSDIILLGVSRTSKTPTSIYLASQIEKDYDNIKISKLARGIPVGGQFEYIDEMTLMRAFDERKEV